MSNQPTPLFSRLCQSSTDELDEEFLRGRAPTTSELSGWEHRGFNVAKATKWLGIRKFIKGFYEDGDELKGYNVKVHQGTDWQTHMPPKRHGFYTVRPVQPTDQDNRHLHAVLLDYGEGDNPKWDPSRGLRDYLVKVGDGVYLGKAYYAVGSGRISLPSYFVLDRLQQN